TPLPMAPRERRPGPGAPTELIGGGPPMPPAEPPPRRELWPWLVVLLVLVLAGIAAGWYATRDKSNATPGAQTRLTTVAAAPAKPKQRPKTTPTVEQVAVPD